MKQFLIDEKTLNEVLGYLSSKPYGEVFRLLDLIKAKVKRVDQPEVTHEEKTEETGTQV